MTPDKLKILFLFIVLPLTAHAQNRQTPDRYPQSDTVKIHLTSEEEVWLGSHRTVRFGIMPDFPPLMFFEDNTYKGIQCDYLRLISERAGIRFEMIPVSVPELDVKAKAGQFDMFPTFNIPERKTYTNFTEPVIRYHSIIITRSETPFVGSLAALKGKTVAIIKGVKSQKFFLAKYPGIRLIERKNVLEALKSVVSGEADAYIGGNILACYLIQKHQLINLKIAGVSDHPPDPYMYAVRKDYPELLGILNKAIASITREEHEDILQKWSRVQVGYRPDWREFIRRAAGITAIFLIILGITLYSNRRMKKEISERIKAEDSLRESENQFRAMFENHYAVMLLVSPENGRIVRANRSALKYYGYDPEPFADMTVFQINQSGKEEVFAEMAKAKAEQRNYFQFQHRLADGGIRDVEVHSSPIPFKGKTLLFSVIHDITERKRAEEDLRKAKESAQSAERMKNTFLAHVSHHLRTPLNSVLGFSEIMADDKSLSPKYREYLSMIRRSGKDLLAMIEQMLAVSKLNPEELGSDPQYQHLLAMLECHTLQAFADEIYDIHEESDIDSLRGEAGKLPRELSDRLVRAAEQLDIGEMLNIIGEIRLRQPSLADALEKTANNFEYEKIRELLG